MQAQNEQATMAALLANMLIGSHTRRAPDFVIGQPGDDYLRRWYLRRDKEFGHIYLHEVLRDDDDRALHDHPWDSASIVLRGNLREVLPTESRILTPGSITCRTAVEPHRLELVDGPVWTLFITGPKIREWGFQDPERGWVHWADYLGGDPTNSQRCGD